MEVKHAIVLIISLYFLFTTDGRLIFIFGEKHANIKDLFKKIHRFINIFDRFFIRYVV